MGAETHPLFESTTFVIRPRQPQQLLAIIILTVASRYAFVSVPLAAFCALIYAFLSGSLIVSAHKYGRVSRYLQDTQRLRAALSA